VLLAVAFPAAAQVVQVNGGDSTLFNATGAGATLYTPHGETQLGAGLLNGHFNVGFAERFREDDWDVALGDSTFNANVGNSGIFTSVRGITISRKDVTLWALPARCSLHHFSKPHAVPAPARVFCFTTRAFITRSTHYTA
jgi:hypothetical protein